MDDRLHTGSAAQGAGYVAWVVNRDACEAMAKGWPLIDRKIDGRSEKAAAQWVADQVKDWTERCDG